MRFAAAWFIWLGIIPAGLIFCLIGAHRRADADRRRFARQELLPRLMDLAVVRVTLYRSILRITCLVCLVIALMGPLGGSRWQEMKQNGLDVMFALDVSKSMLAADIPPSRLEGAKLAIIDFAAKFPGNRMGLVAFAGTGFLQSPLTTDLNAFNAAVTSLTVQSIPRGGTAIGAAIQVARKAFHSSGGGSKILIIVTDGENHEGDPVAEARRAAREGVDIYTIGLGTPNGVTIPWRDPDGQPGYLRDASGNTVTTRLQEGILRDIAIAGHGVYHRASNAAIGLDELYRGKLAKYQRSDINNKWRRQSINLYQAPLAIAILLLFIELLFISGRIPHRPENTETEETP